MRLSPGRVPFHLIWVAAQDNAGIRTGAMAFGTDRLLPPHAGLRIVQSVKFPGCCQFTPQAPWSVMGYLLGGSFCDIFSFKLQNGTGNRETFNELTHSHRYCFSCVGRAESEVHSRTDRQFDAGVGNTSGSPASRDQKSENESMASSRKSNLRGPSHHIREANHRTHGGTRLFRRVGQRGCGTTASEN
jgi:hypothetical protein